MASTSLASSAPQANSRYPSSEYRQSAIGLLKSAAVSKSLERNFAQRNLNGIAQAIESIKGVLDTLRAENASDLEKASELACWEKVSAQAVELQETLKGLNDMLASKGNFNEQVYEDKVQRFIDTYKALTANLEEIQNISGSRKEICQQIQQDLWPETLALLLIGLLFFTKSIPSYSACLNAILADAKKTEQDLTQPLSEQNDTFWLVDETLSALGKNFDHWIKVASHGRKYQKIALALQRLGKGFKVRHKVRSNARRNIHPNARHNAHSSRIQLNEQIKNQLLALSANRINEYQCQCNQELLQDIKTSLASLEGRLNSVGKGESITPQQVQGIKNELETFKQFIGNEAGTLHATDQKLSEQMAQLERGVQLLIASAAVLGKKDVQKKTRKPIQRVTQQRNVVAAKELKAREEAQAATNQQVKGLGAALEKKIHTQVEQFTRDISELQQKQARLEQDIVTINAKLTTHEGDKADARKRLALIEEKTKLLKNERERLLALPNGASAPLARLEQHLQFFRDERNRVLERLGGAEQLIEFFQQDLKALRENKAETNKEVEALRKQVEEQEARLKELKVQQEALADAVEGRIKTINDRLSALSQEKTDREAALKRVREETAQTAAASAQELEVALEAVNHQIATQVDQLDQLKGQQATDAQAAEVRVKAIDDRLSALSQEKTDREAALKHVREEIAQTAAASTQELEVALEAVNHQIATQVDQLDQLKGQQATDAEAVQEQIKAVDDRLSALSQEKTDREAALKRVREETAQTAAASAQELEVALEAVNHQIATQVDQLDQLKGQQATDAQVVQEQIKAIDDRLSVLSNEKTDREAALKRVREEIAQTAAASTQELEAALETVNYQITAQVDQLDQLKGQQATDAQAVQEQIKAIDDRLSALSQEKTDREVALKRVREEIAQTAAASTQELEAALETVNHQITAQVDQLDQLKGQQATDAQVVQEQIKAIDDRLSVLSNEKTDREAALKRVREEIAQTAAASTQELEAALEAVNYQITAQVDQLDQLKGQRATDAQAVQEQVKAIDDRLSVLSNEKTDREAALKRVREEIAQTAAASTQELEVALETVNHQITAQVDQLDQLKGQQATDAQAVQEQIKAIDDRLSVLSNEKTDREAALKRVREEIAQTAAASTQELEAALETVNYQITAQVNQLDQLKGQQATDAQAAEVRVKAIDDRLSVLSNEKTDREAALKRVREEIAQTAAASTQELEVALETVNHQITAQVDQLDQLKGQQATDAQAAEVRVKAIDDRLSVLSNEKTDREAALKRVREEIAQTAAASTQELEVALEAVNHQITMQVDQLDQLKGQRATDAQAAEVRVKAIDDRLSALSQEKTDREAALKRVREEIAQTAAASTQELEVALEAVNHQIATQVDQLDQLKGQRATDAEAVQEQIKAIDDRLSVLSNEKTDREVALKRIREEIAQTAATSTQELEAALETVNSQITAQVGQLNQLKGQQKTAVEAVEDISQTIKGHEAALMRLERGQAALGRKDAKIDETVDAIKAEQKKLRTQQKGTNAALTKAEVELKGRLDGFEVEIGKLAQMLKAAEKREVVAGKKLGALKTTGTETSKTVAEQKNQLIQLKGEQNALEAEQAKQEAALNLARQEAQQEVAAITQRLEVLEEDRVDVIKQFKKHDTSLTQLENDQQAIKSLKEQVELLKKQVTWLSEPQTKEQSLERQAQTQLAFYEEEKTKAESGLKAVQQEIDQFDNAIEAVQSQLKLLEDKKVELGNAEQQIGQFGDAIQEVQTQLTQLDKQQADACSQLKFLEEKRANVVPRLTDAAQKIERLKTEIEEIEATLSQLKEQQKIAPQATQKEISDLRAALEQGLASVQLAVNAQADELNKIKPLEEQSRQQQDNLQKLEGELSEFKNGHATVASDHIYQHATKRRSVGSPRPPRIQTDQVPTDHVPTNHVPTNKKRDSGYGWSPGVRSPEFNRPMANFGRRSSFNRTDSSFMGYRSSPEPIYEGPWKLSAITELSDATYDSDRTSSSNGSEGPVISYPSSSPEPLAEYTYEGPWKLPIIAELSSDATYDSDRTNSSNGSKGPVISYPSSSPEPSKKHAYRTLDAFNEKLGRESARASEEDSQALVAFGQGQEERELLDEEWLLEEFNGVLVERREGERELANKVSHARERSETQEREEKYQDIVDELKSLHERGDRQMDDITRTQSKIKIQAHDIQSGKEDVADLKERVALLEKDMKAYQAGRQQKEVLTKGMEGSDLSKAGQDKMQKALNPLKEGAGASSAPSTDSSLISLQTLVGIQQSVEKLRLSQSNIKEALEGEIRKLEQKLSQPESGGVREKRRSASSERGRRMRSMSVARDLRRADNLSTINSDSESSSQPFALGTVEAEGLKNVETLTESGGVREKRRSASSERGRRMRSMSLARELRRANNPLAVSSDSDSSSRPFLYGAAEAEKLDNAVTLTQDNQGQLNYLAKKVEMLDDLEDKIKMLIEFKDKQEELGSETEQWMQIVSDLTMGQKKRENMPPVSLEVTPPASPEDQVVKEVLEELHRLWNGQVEFIDTLTLTVENQGQKLSECSKSQNVMRVEFDQYIGAVNSSIKEAREVSKKIAAQSESLGDELQTFKEYLVVVKGELKSEFATHDYLNRHLRSYDKKILHINASLAEIKGNDDQKQRNLDMLTALNQDLQTKVDDLETKVQNLQALKVFNARLSRDSVDEEEEASSEGNGWDFSGFFSSASPHQMA